MISLVGRKPDLVIPPNPGAKKGIEQWVWTKDRSRYKRPFSCEYGWIRVFVYDGNLVLESEYGVSQSFLEVLDDLKYEYARSRSFVEFLKKTSSQYLVRESLSFENPADLGPARPPICDGLYKLGDIKVVGNDRQGQIVSCDFWAKSGNTNEIDLVGQKRRCRFWLFSS